MKKIFFILLLISGQNIVRAQVWCTSGSQWHFTHYSIKYGGDGVIKWNYLYDTLTGGKICNKIKGITLSQYADPVEYFIYTYSSNNVVYDRSGSNENNFRFDTLYNFKANIGDKWRMAPTSLTLCGAGRVIVQDTGSRIIQGQRLKWLRVNYKSAGYNLNDTIFERFGSLLCFPYHAGNICDPSYYTYGGPLRCFSDNQIINYRNNFTGACDSYISSSVAEYTFKSSLIKFYPNPVSDLLNVEFNSSILRDFNTECELVVTDMYGREMKKVKILLKSLIDLKDLTNGIYFVTVSNKSQILATTKIIKD